MKTVLVSGGDGKFASKLKESKDFNVLTPPKSVMDVRDFGQVDYLIGMVKPDYFVDTAYVHGKQAVPPRERSGRRDQEFRLRRRSGKNYVATFGRDRYYKRRRKG